MQTTSALWDTYYAADSKQYEYKAVIGSDEYANADIYGLEVTGGVCTEEAFSLGNCISRKLNISVKPKVTPIPKMASVVVSVRMNGSSGPTDYLPVGTFYIDTRAKGLNRIDLECWDAMLKLETPFITSEEIDDFPMSMTDALAIILAQLGVTMANPLDINAAFDIEYPNEKTMREVLSNIGSANGGNFIIDANNQLRLVIPANGTAVDDAPHKGFDEINDARTISRVTMVWGDGDGEYFTAGDDTGDELVVANDWATQAICDYVFALLDGYVHTPYTCSGAYINPAVEPGDTVTFDEFDGVILYYTTRYAAGSAVWDVGAGGDGAVEHEYPYQGTFERKLKNKVGLGSAYYGVTISRAQGLKIAKTDGSAEAIFNSDVLTMRALDGGVMTNKIYFDPVAGKYIFDGELSADVITALSAVITPNLYAEKATIAELTVDQLDTSVKVKRYLDSDASDVNYLKIKEQTAQWITAQTDGLTTEQAEDRNGSPLYWTDETHTASTTDETDYPVTIYVYTDYVKAEFSFHDDGTNYIPRIVLGTGTGVGDNDKLIIIKETSKATIEYTTAGGNRMAIEMSADGMRVKGNTVANGIRNVYYGEEPPENPEFGDMWFDTSIPV